MRKISALMFILLLFICLSSTTTYASSDILGPSVIHKEKNQVFTISDLLSLYDRDVFIYADEYTGHGNVAGEYIITLYQGEITKDVLVVVIDKWGSLQSSTDVLFVTDYKDIYVANDRYLSLYEILYDIYGSTGYIDTSYQFRYEELTDTYHDNFSEDGLIDSGAYELSFNLTFYNGNQASYYAQIHTKEIVVSGILIEAPPTALDKGIAVFPYVIAIIGVTYLLRHRKKKRGFTI
jgi:hypothetical protein